MHFSGSAEGAVNKKRDKSEGFNCV